MAEAENNNTAPNDSDEEEYELPDSYRLPQVDFVVIAAETDKEAAEGLRENLQSDDVEGIYFTDDTVVIDGCTKQPFSQIEETISNNFDRATYKLLFVTKDFLTNPSTRHRTYSVIYRLFNSSDQIQIVWADPKKDIESFADNEQNNPADCAFARTLVEFNGSKLGNEEEMNKLKNVLKGARDKKDERRRWQQLYLKRWKEERTKFAEQRKENPLLDFSADHLLVLDVKPVAAKYALEELEKEMVYQMKSKPRGRLLIINNIKFDNNPEFITKPGLTRKRTFAEYDAQNLKRLFKQLYFEVSLKKNLSAGEMKQCILKESQRDHSAYDAFFLCVMSHGYDEAVYGTDWKTILVEEHIIQPFSEMNVGEQLEFPMVFIIQACREGKEEMTSARHPKQKPAKSHTLIVQSTLPGNLAYVEDAGTGSWFIREFIRSVASYAHVCDLQHILKKVNREMKKKVAIKCAHPVVHDRQYCEVTDRGFEFLHFLPGYKG